VKFVPFHANKGFVFMCAGILETLEAITFPRVLLTM
jgi:hypothetical protein